MYYTLLCFSQIKVPEGELHQSGVADDVIFSLGLNLVASLKTFVYSDAEAHVVDSVEDAVVLGQWKAPLILQWPSPPLVERVSSFFGRG